MTATTAHAPSRARLRVLLLAALAALIALLFPAGTASAATLTAAQTGVGVSHPAATGSVGLHQRITAGQRRDGPRSQPQIVSGHCVAAEDGIPMSQMTRTGSALKGDVFHRSVSWVVDNPAAQKFATTGGDGVTRDLYQLPGELNGKPGVYEWIVDKAGSEPVITHQRFIPGGSVTGYPNQVP